MSHNMIMHSGDLVGEGRGLFQVPPLLESLRKYSNTMRTTYGLSTIRTRYLHIFTGYCVWELDNREEVVAN